MQVASPPRSNCWNAAEKFKFCAIQNVGRKALHKTCAQEPTDVTLFPKLIKLEKFRSENDNSDVGNDVEVK